MHPWEDFAETWAAYLDMASALDTAQHTGFGGHQDPVSADLEALVRRYQELGIALNEMNRAQGLLDLVPEVFVPAVIDKLRFIHELVRTGRSENGIFQPAGAAAVSAPAVTVAPASMPAAPAAVVRAQPSPVGAAS